MNRFMAMCLLLISTAAYAPIIPHPTMGVPTGAIMAFGMGSCPAGWLEADGIAKATATYPNLDAAFGETWGLRSGGTFQIPNLNNSGRYLRGGTPGNYQGQATAANGLGGTAAGQTYGTSNVALSSGSAVALGQTLRALGEKTIDAGNHNHGLGMSWGGPLPSGATLNYALFSGGTSIGVSGTHTHAFGGTTDINHSHSVSGTTDIGHTHNSSALSITSTDTETRPTTAVVKYCIKY